MKDENFWKTREIFEDRKEIVKNSFLQLRSNQNHKSLWQTIKSFQKNFYCHKQKVKTPTRKVLTKVIYNPSPKTVE